MAKGALALHQQQAGSAGPLGSRQYGPLYRPGRVVYPHRIERNPCAGDQDAGLARADEAGLDPGLAGGGGQFQAGAHFANGHVRPHRQNPLAGQARRQGRRHGQPLGFLAQIPNPLPRGLAGGGQGGVVAEAAMQATGQIQAGLQRHHQIAHHLGRHDPPRRGQPHHGYGPFGPWTLGPKQGQGLSQGGHDRHGAADAGERL